MTGTKPPQIAIYGSCVSRDMSRISLEPKVKCALYVARQSLISVGTSARGREIGEPSFPHPFQQNSFLSDIRGDGLKRIHDIRNRIDLVVVDIVDERHGIYVHPDGPVLTRSIDGVSVHAYDHLEGWEYYDFGTTEHLGKFKAAVERGKNALERWGLFDKTVVICTAWATELNTGDPVPQSMGKNAEDINKLLPLYEAPFEELGFRVARPDPATVIGDANHLWGPAPFHFIKPFYDSIAKQILPLLPAPMEDEELELGNSSATNGESE